MKKFLLPLLFCMLLSWQAKAEKYALIIAVGDYPARTGWSDISSVNDVGLIKNTLINQEFKKDNILILTNEMATRQGILNAFEDLQSRIQPGDIVVIHYSGHGQQIFDDNADEIDDQDEALVPYDALVRYTSNYKGENHIRDDELGNVFTTFRNALGKDGQLLILLDSCHSGSATRGGIARGGQATFAPPNWSPSSNNHTPGSGLVERSEISEDAAPFIFISGASADELNYEYEGYGSLSFSFSKAMNDLGSDISYRKLFAAISANMNIIAPNQTPTIEGDADYKLFNGDYVKQQPYFEVSDIARADILRINAGKLQHLFDGTTVNILPAGTTQVEENAIITKGTITRSTFTESLIQLEQSLNSNNEKLYWVFVDKPSYGDVKLNIYYDNSFSSRRTKKSITSFLEDNKIGEVVNDTIQANVIIAEDANNLIIQTVNGKSEIYRETKTDGDYNAASVTKVLYNYAQGSYLKDLSLKNLDYEFEFRLRPATLDETTNEVMLLEKDAFIDEAGKFKVNTAEDAVVLEVTNKSDRPLYFSIIEINTKGEIAPFMPNDNCSLNDNERRIAPGKTMIFKDCIFYFGPPYETLVLKGFATETPINFQPTVTTSGQSNTRGAGQNPLESFVSQTYSQTRGAGARRVKSKIDGFSTEFIYEIVESKE